ncbi:MAG: 50S ribosomal protein P1 [Candidatus Aenigmatarchaeota archaeon]
MEYVQSAMLLHSAGQEVNEENVTKVLEAAGIDVEESRVKALIAALEDVDIEEAIKQASVPAAGAAPAPSAEEESEEGEEAEEEEADEEEEEEEAAEGLGSLFDE